MRKIKKNRPTHIIFGLGKSGLSCARYFDRISQKYFIVDSRKQPSGQDQLSDLTFCQGYQFGDIDTALLENCKQLIVSPGISLKNKFVSNAIDKKIDVCGDVEIFARECKKPIVAITGSNGKSTVTDLTDQLITATNIDSQKGGNIGLPVLDFLPQDKADIYVLELSSFQLDSCSSLSLKIGICLNITEDHMDRYNTFSDYVASKHKIYERAESVIFNQDDHLTFPAINNEQNQFSFTIEKATPKDKVIGCLEKSDIGYQLVVSGKPIVSTQNLKVTGTHNWANVLVSLSILHLLNIDITKKVLNRLETYRGLEHRFQLVSRTTHCDWINDSKATNVGATVAALKSLDLSDGQKVILIAGGDSKESNLEPLIEPINSVVQDVILMGVDANKIASLPLDVNVYQTKNMRSAVNKANELIDDKKTIVLLSPACASLDMYSSFEERGNDFIDSVRACA